MTAFVGANSAFLLGDTVLAIQRDDFPGLPWPGLWDLPGGGREGDESPEDCALRELREELGLVLPPTRLLARSEHPSGLQEGGRSFFFVGRIAVEEVALVRLGDEGQGWRMMPVAEFLAPGCAVPQLQVRLAGQLGLIAG